ncbi:glycoside hydrolase family 88 protein [Pedobacter sp. SD-b]|uniref:Glycoside hydrolase family 88 protein n=1 Tax=Pedobacter segetis TaxID=2793069 RepID=A0ABS1BM96_9SPHI|nr:glycoside hydrolase family 88 protein [Pedobacter segetis]MBK0383933.1 glycoside hydrolase family 88 protein [Pedobacter segetis]
MRKSLSFIILMIVCLSTYAQKTNVKHEFRFAENQVKLMLHEIKNQSPVSNEVSPRTLENGKLKLSDSGDWTSGFFPGILWYLYEYTGDKKWSSEAEKFTANLKNQEYNKGTHDLGLMLYTSFGNGYRLTNDNNYKQVIINAAKSLSTRFNPKAGVIKSWDHREDLWTYPVIIDNMMNLELLFEATKLSGDSSFYNIAVQHANNTLKNHFRKDYSSYHVVDYNPKNGTVIKKTTHQGYSNESSWSRGQAWGLYGFTMCFRETGDSTYLKQAEHIANYILTSPKIPKDMIPYWDYDDPAIPNAPRDASAAAITSSALFELASQTKSTYYEEKAQKILESLSEHYKSPKNGDMGFILEHSTGHKPYNSEVDVPIIYADYYYIEALLRSQKSYFKIDS